MVLAAAQAVTRALVQGELALAQGRKPIARKLRHDRSPAEAAVIRLCVPKIRFVNIGGEVHRELALKLSRRGA